MPSLITSAEGFSGSMPSRTLGEAPKRKDVTMAGKYVAPDIHLHAFTCLYCETLTAMRWMRHTYHDMQGRYLDSRYVRCECTICGGASLWRMTEGSNGVLVEPPVSSGPAPHDDLPEDCLPDYQEARDICSRSPRGAAALLRLCLQKLLVHLGGDGKSIDTDIKKLVAAGLDTNVQQALDVIRVTGNNAVHPLEMNLKDDHDSVIILFQMINFIVDERISRPAMLADRFNKLPAGAREAIARRDAPKPAK